MATYTRTQPSPAAVATAPGKGVYNLRSSIYLRGPSNFYWPGPNAQRAKLPMVANRPRSTVRSTVYLRPSGLYSPGGYRQKSQLIAGVKPSVIVPSISNYAPPATSTTSITFDAADPRGYRYMVVHASSPTGGLEIVWDGLAFTPAYSISSTATPIMNGYHFSILRTGGWAGTPMITVVSVAGDINTVGNV